MAPWYFASIFRWTNNKNNKKYCPNQTSPKDSRKNVEFLCSQNCETPNLFAHNMPETIDWLESQLTRVPDVYPSTDGKFSSSPVWFESQASVRRLTLKLFGSSPSRLEYPASVRRPLLKLFGSSPSRLSFNRRRNCWLTSHPSVLRQSQPLTTHVLDVCHPPVTETKMSPIFCTAKN